ncbi:MAG: Fic family protein [Turicibacter sp.]|nr:Fic family protein [Turicibacter sp.]
MTEDQTRYIFETKTIGVDAEGVPVDDVIETSNHFRCFDYLLDTIEQPLNVEVMWELHRLLKGGTSDSHKAYFNVGGWKKMPDEVGGVATSKPEDVAIHIDELLASYHGKEEIKFEDIVAFHFEFENIHPYQDGNGRVGRLIMFRECLKHDIMPFIIADEMKAFYYRELREFNYEPGYLLDTCGAAQDMYQTWVDYFYPELSK